MKKPRKAPRLNLRTAATKKPPPAKPLTIDQKLDALAKKLDVLCVHEAVATSTGQRTVEIAERQQRHHEFLVQISGTLHALLQEVKARTMLNYPVAAASVINDAPLSPEQRLHKMENDVAELKARMRVGWPKP